MSKNILTEPLKYSDLKVILGELFEFDVIKDDKSKNGINILIDGVHSFYHPGYCNNRHDLYTLGGIFQYLEHISHLEGQRDIKNGIKTILGL